MSLMRSGTHERQRQTEIYAQRLRSESTTTTDATERDSRVTG